MTLISARKTVKGIIVELGKASFKPTVKKSNKIQVRGRLATRKEREAAGLK
jgi:hypothetical protein